MFLCLFLFFFFFVREEAAQLIQNLHVIFSCRLFLHAILLYFLLFLLCIRLASIR